ncbi:leucyl/phenylalanyl-tRNA--protein transferase [Polynucleobacter wuianus]|uniref:Leucyl/phenylalanyl-tRNA--protein transferase n=1 Tax=Polynucleobacter wuianus TaxID=1743168 RepID=A0A191UE80_9BURK|nr:MULTISPECIES: leucyl/phenylalanyl-tRNA--protein transferase [Polynucleobacter]ANI99368.1 leucyl/phenylalanyl-tRNA--protein transferase [Polynucleobacter wuianus]MBU3552028.1 leucyl/phenylalanyl-tRNA--protein transferase [Polynucleobacter sp. MWH-Post4-6-1]
MSQITWLGPHDVFPNPLLCADPDSSVPGLIVVSERIYPGQLLQAYRLGIFPWYSDKQPVLWWSPDPRMVLKPNHFKCSESLRKNIRHFCQDTQSQLLVDQNFGEVIRACATSSRKDQDGTWITHEIMDAYTTIHEQGHAHSIALAENGELIGGLYCVALGGMVFGESMFSRKPNASKMALAALSAWCIQNEVVMIDCQQETAHLSSLGAAPISRTEFLHQLQTSLNQSNIEKPWNFDKNILTHWL